jgi:hypothetical protein
MKMCGLLVPIAADSELARESPQLSGIPLNMANIHRIGILVKRFGPVPQLVQKEVIL